MVNYTLNRFLLTLTIIASATLQTYASSASDSTKTKKDSTRVSYFYNDFEKFGTVSTHPLDTNITGFQNYNPILKLTPFYASQGNIGQASLNLIPYPFFSNPGFDYGIHSFDGYMFKNDSLKYYRVLKTFTELTFEQGAKKEVFFNVVFSRNIYRSLNLGFDFRVMNAPGAYLRQRTNLINFDLTLQYFSKNKRYGVIANYLANRVRAFENGGIKYDSIFEQNLESNRQVFAINLQQAQNTVRETGIYMKHYLSLSRHPKSPNDTAFASRKHFDLGKLTYTFQYNRQSLAYSDNYPKSGFYKNIFLDTIQTYDSIVVARFINDLSWSNPSYKPDKKFRLLQIEAHFRQQYIEVKDHFIKNFFIQYIPSAEISFHPYSGLFLLADGNYVMGDYNGGDLALHATLSQILGNPAKKNGGTISVKGAYAFQTPAWFYEQYYGNHFRWDTTFQKQNLISATFEYSFRNAFSAGVNISRIEHYVYLDSAVAPAQFSKQFGYIYSYLKTSLDIWHFKLVGNFAYQTVQGTDVLRLPAFLMRLNLYFTQPLFKKAAILQPGLTFRYNTYYYADNYMPAIQSYYLQHSTEVGNYLYMDIFVNVKIQRARFFVEYEHVNAGLMGRTYYSVPSYPNPDAAFRFGIAWRFHD